MALAAAIAGFLLVAGLVFLVGYITTARANSAADRLRELIPTQDTRQPTQQMANAFRPDMMPTVTHMMRGRAFGAHLMDEISAAGLPVRPSEFIGIVAALFVFSQLLAWLVARSLLGYLVFGLVAITVPLMILGHLKEKRRIAFEHQIADALILMASSLRSGFSFLRAIQMVAQEMSPPIAREFERVVNEVNIGRPLDDALRAVVGRIRSYDFDLVVTAVLIQQQVGGNLADILDTIAATMRDRARVLGEVRALTAEGKLSGVVLVMLPVILGVAMALLNPNYMSVLLYEPIGHLLLGVAAALQIIGGLIIRRMLVLEI